MRPATLGFELERRPDPSVASALAAEAIAFAPDDRTGGAARLAADLVAGSALSCWWD